MSMQFITSRKARKKYSLFMALQLMKYMYAFSRQLNEIKGIFISKI